MGQFLVHMGQFALLLCITLATGFGVNKVLMDSDGYAADPDTKTIIIGDSHAVYAFNPSLIPGSVNVALEGESYPITYLKLSRILSEDVGIENIVLTFSPHHISAFNDRKFSDEPWRSYVFDKYYPLLSWEILKRFEVDWVRYGRSVVQNEILPNRMYAGNRLRELLNGGKKSYPYIGGFVSIAGSTLSEEELVKRVERHFGGEDSVIGVSTTSTSSLETIVGLAEDRDKRLILVGTPLHPEYSSRIPHAIWVEYDRLRSDLGRKSHVSVCSFESGTPADTMFYDYDHVNQVGAAWVSSSISEFLQAGVDEDLLCE